MFSIRQLPPPLHLMQPLLAGITYGFFDQPVLFEVQASGAPGPFQVELVCSRNKTKGAFELATERTSNSMLRLAFYNPTEGGSSGLSAPLLLLVTNGVGLSLIFTVDIIGSGEAFAFRLTYAFGEAPFDEDLLKNKGDSK